MDDGSLSFENSSQKAVDSAEGVSGAARQDPLFDRYCRLIVENYPGGALWLFDEELRFLAHGGRGVRENGRPELVGRTVFEAFAGETAEKLAKHCRNALSGAASNCELSWDGDLYDVKVVPIPDENGVIRRGMAVAQVVTERKRMEAALLESESRFRRLFDDVPAIAVQGYDKTRTVIYWNEASECLYGYSREQALGRRLEELIIPPYMREQVIEHVERWVTQGVPIPAGELGLMRKDGSIVQVYSSHVLQRNASGDAELYCLDVDLAELKQAEREMLKAKEAAEKASKAKSDFLAHMSHELRTPLNGVLGMAELTLMEDVSPRAREYQLMLKQSAKALLGLVNDILDLSRIEVGKIELENAPFNVREFLESTLASLELSAREKGLALRQVVSDEVPARLHGDVGRLRQVLVNLVSNAVKYSNQGAIVVSARGEPVLGRQDKARLVLKVSDAGVGIPADKLDEIFESFAQIPASAPSRKDGAGLGLAISKRLVELMGGRVWAESVEGVGSDFHVSIPLDVAGDAGQTAREDTVALKRSGSGMNVLLVEDQAVNRVVAADMLGKAGYAVDVAEDGFQALERLRAKRYDLVLMDVRMPVMDGLEAAQRIRRGEAGDPDTPIIALTACALKGDREAILEAGMNDYLAKPFELADLMKALEAVTPPAAGRGLAPSPGPSPD